MKLWVLAFQEGIGPADSAIVVVCSSVVATLKWWANMLQLSLSGASSGHVPGTCCGAMNCPHFLQVCSGDYVHTSNLSVMISCNV